MKIKQYFSYLFFAVTAFIISFVISSEVYATNHYVREGAAGANDGADWTNAWTELTATLIRGDTYYIADGEYPRYSCDDALSGTEIITIKKAVDSDHGTDTGWASEYGDGQAVWRTSGTASAITITTSYWLIDGVTSAGSDSNSYGFKLTTEGDCDASWILLMSIAPMGGAYNVDYTTVKNTAFILPGIACGNGEHSQTAIYSYPKDACNYITIQDCYVSNGSTNIEIARWNNCTIDNVYFDGNWSSSNRHGQQMSPSNRCENITVKNCTFMDSQVFVISFHETNGYNSNWNVYNNLIIGGSSTVRVFGSTDTDNLVAGRFHHNTTIGIDMGGYGFVSTKTLSDPINGRSYAYNNLFVNCANPQMSAVTVPHDYNAYFDITGVYFPGDHAILGTGNPLTSDYKLKPEYSHLDVGISDTDVGNAQFPAPPPPEGSLQVTIDPSDVRTDARWRLTAGPDTDWKQHNESISNIPPENYTLQFNDVTGQIKPADKNITINEGANTDSGTYTLQVGAVFELNTKSIDFGNKSTGTSTGDTFTILNTGDLALDVSSISSSNGTIFSVSPTTGTVDPAGSMTVTVTFSPVAAQSYSETITVTTEDGTDTVTVNGAGVATPEPVLALNKNSIDFGNKSTGTSTGDTFTILNTGDAALDVSSISSSNGTIFSVSPTTGTVDPAGNMTVTVTFSPVAAQSYLETITVTSDDGTDTVTVNGAGVAATEPVLALNKNSIDFGNKSTGTSTGETFIISNTGDAALDVSSISSSNGTIFSVSPATGTVDPAGNMTVTVTFSPVAVQSYSETITVTSDDGTDTVTVNGAGVAATEPVLALNKNSIDFGNKSTGTSTGETFIISNTGDAALDVSSISSSNGTIFSVSPTSGTVDPAGSMTVTVTFSPVAVQSYSETITVTSDDGTDTVTVNGAGVAATEPVLALNKNSIDFGNKITGTSTDSTFTISNTGDAALNVSSISSSNGTIFSVSPTSGTVDPAGNMTVTVTFSSDAVQSYSETITVTSDDGTDTVTVNGAGVAATEPVLALNKNSIDFGNKSTGTSTGETFIISNTGDAALNVSSISSSNGTIFSVSPTTGTVDPAGSMTVTVTFSPDAVQSYSETITMTTNDGADTVTVNGAGIAAPEPVLALNKNSIDFGNKTTGTRTDSTFTISNTGDATLDVSSISSSNGTIYSVSPTTGTVDPSGSMTVTVTFTPDAVQSYSETITVTSDGGTDTVTVNGAGVATPEPVLALNTNSIDFGSKTSGTSTDSTFTISNTGDATLDVSSISSSNGTIFSVSPTTGAVDPSGSMTVTVTFAPDAVQSYSETITVTSDGGTDNLAVSGVGTSQYIPLIASVTINPDSGWVTTGDSVNITAVEENGVNELIPSNAIINGKSIPLSDQGDGTYTGIYIIEAGDNQGENIEATNITLSDTTGNESQPASSTGSKLSVDTIPPEIISVELIPGAAKIAKVFSSGESINILVVAKDNETGLIPSDAIINNNSIRLSDEGNGTYMGVHIIGADDNDTDVVEATNITLTDAAGNTSIPASTISEFAIMVTANIDPAASDFDSNGKVDFFDFTIFILAYGKEEGQSGWDSLFDLNSDSIIDLSDFYIFFNNYGTVISSVAGAARTTVMPETDISLDFEIEVDESSSVSFVKVSFSDISSLFGFEFSLSYDENALEFDSSKIDGLVGLYIPSDQDGIVRITSIFNDEEFKGTVTLGFKYQDVTKAKNIELLGGLVIDNISVKKIPEMPEGYYDRDKLEVIINDLAASNPLEEKIKLSWTSPAATDNSNPVSAYQVELGLVTPQGEKLGVRKNIELEITPQTPGNKEEVSISGLRPGYPYYITVNSFDQNGKIIGLSNTTSIQTLISFVDEDLDSADPFITRDNNSLFVADNDESITFVWSSLESLGASNYEVTVRNNTTFQVINIIVVKETSFTLEGEPGQKYSLMVVPLNSSGDRLGTFLSRQILCMPGFIDKPGTPVAISQN